MGSCISRPDGCVGGQRSSAEATRRRRRRRTIRRRAAARKVMETIDEAQADQAPYGNPAFQAMISTGSTEEAWFDTFSAVASDEEDFRSVQDDAFSINSFEGEDILSPSSFRDGSIGASHPNASSISSIDRQQKGRKLGEQSPKNLENTAKAFVSLEDLSIMPADANAGGHDGGILNNCGILPNNCLPCLVAPVSTAEKRKALCSSPPNSAKKTSLKLSFKWKPFLEKPLAGSQVPFCLLEKQILDSWSHIEPSTFKVRGPHYLRDKKKDFAPNNAAYCPFGVDVYLCQQKINHIARFVELPNLSSSGRFPPILVVNIQPLAGSQVPFCLLEKQILDSWSHIEPSTFKVRGPHYLRDKKKDFAPNNAAYCPFGVDVYLCQQKINHIARFVELPNLSSSGRFPPILVVNIQVPLYPATIFQSETDGEGMSFVLYFRLSEDYSEELPSHFLENIRRIIDDEVERVKGFPMDALVPFRERLKVLVHAANLEDLHLNTAERKLINTYNERPVLSRPQHDFYLGNNYFEIDLDIHRFSYIARKGFEAFLDRLKLCVLDFGLTIQGNKPEDLPEHILCCVRLNNINYTNYLQLAVNSHLAQ
ncbi:hypothetical protein C4D60_Mb05t03280 [Musa balbisiana]|uniref:Protein ENHANCED DISEASE RESISTANCE 2 C-terminal domain-containing protein n=1 Tax=Musa balbisiana TaxID=52838 RepID=A0A4V6T4J5_MUSBA|nr:hypothetical protein C4D60_Mb05t03280 [Musa balbisiana]